MVLPECSNWATDHFWGDNLMLHLKDISIGNNMKASSKLLKILHYK